MIFKSQQSTMEGLQLIPQQYSKIYTTAFQSHDSIPITLNDLDIECQIWLLVSAGHENMDSNRVLCKHKNAWPLVLTESKHM